jgi:hypothetical protein
MEEDAHASCGAKAGAAWDAKFARLSAGVATAPLHRFISVSNDTPRTLSVRLYCPPNEEAPFAEETLEVDTFFVAGRVPNNGLPVRVVAEADGVVYLDATTMSTGVGIRDALPVER